MRAWKIAAILTLLLGSVAFAWPTVTVTPTTTAPGGLNGLMPGDTFTLTIAMGDPAGLAMTAVDVYIKPTANVATCDLYTSRTLLSEGALDEFVTAKGTSGTHAVKTLGPAGWDLGLTSSSGEGETAATDLARYTFTVLESAPVGQITLPITGAFDSTTGFQDGVNLGSLQLTIAPEPASMLLLALGAAFFYRRRRA